MPPSVVLVLRAVRKAFRAGIPGCSASTIVLDGAELVVRAGERVAIVGPPGSGKTTLLLLAAGLLCPDVGDAWRLPDAMLLPRSRPRRLPRRSLRAVSEPHPGSIVDRLVWSHHAARGATLVEVPAGRPPPPWTTRVVAVRGGALHDVAREPATRRAAR